MSFIHPFSDECTSSQLDVFKIPSTVTAVDSEKYVNFKPTASLSSGNWIEFMVPGTEEFVDLSAIYLDIELKILKSDGSNLPNAVSTTNTPNLYKAITPANNFLSSLFQQLDIYLNNTLITTATNAYHYRSYLDCLFYQSKQAKETFMYTQLWQEDENERKKMIERIYSGKSIKLTGPLFFDLGQQERLLLNFVELRFRLNLLNPSYILKIDSNVTDRPKIELIDATLFVCKKRLFPDAEAGIINALQTNTVKYFFTSTEVMTRLIDSGSTSFFFDNIYRSTLPRRLVIGIVKAKAYNGDWNEDIFNFNHHGLAEIYLTWNADQNPVPAIALDIEDDDYARAYYLFYNSMFSLHPQTTLSITPSQFKRNCTFYAWNLTTENDLENTDTIGLIRTGHIRINLRFKKAVSEHLIAIIYSHFPMALQIDSTRNVMIETV